MPNLRFVLLLCLIAAAPFAAQDRRTERKRDSAQPQEVTIRVGTLLDGKGGVRAEREHCCAGIEDSGRQAGRIYKNLR